ncbi:MAG: twin-arginine translocation signal domain-containing protein [Paracoccus sp. (in: a-proteobacteria)]
MTAQPRRSFLKLALAAGAAPALGALAGPAFAQTAERRFAPQPGNWRRYETVTSVKLAESGPAQVWLPVPALQTDYQRALGNVIAGNATSAEIVTDKASGAQYLHARFEGGGTPELTLTSQFETRGRRTD